LNTDLRFVEELDGRKLRNLNGSTGFDWKHTDNLWTHYVFDGRWSDSEVQTATNLNARFFLRHQLYDSLQTHLELFGEFEDASFRTQSEFGGSIAENYLKRLGDWGRLNISVSPHASIAYNRAAEDSAFVFNESHVLVGTQMVLLRRQDISASSIVVTDENGLIVYGAGDYTITQIGGGIETELRRIVGGNIADGDRVLVDYEYEIAGDNDTLSVGVDVSTSLTFLDHWNVFGRYGTLDFNVLSGDEDDLRFNSFDRYLAGMEFNSRWFSAKAEFEDYNASISPSWGYVGSASVFTYGVGTWSGRLRTTYSYRNHGNQGQTVNRLTVSGGGSKRFFKRGLLEGEGSWLRGRWSGQSSESNDVDSLHLKMKYSWWYGKVEVKLETGFAQIFRPSENRKVFHFDLRVRRVF
jgi:hypothetical protein